MALSPADLLVGQRGMSGALEAWLSFNMGSGLHDPEGRPHIAAFPPRDLMRLTTTLTEEVDFAAHGGVVAHAIADASPRPLNRYSRILDFGCGVGRLARMFMGFDGEYVGVDVHEESVQWINDALPFMTAYCTTPRAPLPFPDNHFDCVISVSVFTHMNEADQIYYLSELRRITCPGGILLLTVHGFRALKRALFEESIFRMLNIPRHAVDAALESFADGTGFSFFNQMDHLSSERYEYGITFINRQYIERVWNEHFRVMDIAVGSIHDFQDIVVLEAT